MSQQILSRADVLIEFDQCPRSTEDERPLFEHFIRQQKVHSSSICYASILQEALNRNLSVGVIGEQEVQKYGLTFQKGTRPGNIFSVSDGNRTVIFNKTKCWLLGEQKPDLPKSKSAFKAILHQLGLGCAAGHLIDTRDKVLIQAKADALQFPLVLKPDSGSMGKGVFVGLRDHDELMDAISTLPATKPLLLEQCVSGREYRVYLVGGHFVCAVRRLPAQVEGDGVSSVLQLIKAENIQRKKSRFGAIKVDEQTKLALQQQQLQLSSVPAKGELVVLGWRLGRSSGGKVVFATQDFPKAKRTELERLAKYFPTCHILGVDVILDGENLVVLEANTRPQLSSALLPDEGQSINLARLLITHFFPNSRLAAKFNALNLRAIKQALKANPDTTFLFEPSAMNDKKAQAMTPVASVNSLPLYQGNLSTIVRYASSESFLGLGNINQVMLRRAAWQAGFAVDIFFNAQKKKRWTVQGNGRLLKFRENMPPQTSQATRKLTNDKQKTKQRLEEHGIAVPSGLLIRNSELQAATTWFEQLRVKKAVVKPLDGSGGRGVTSAIASVEVLHQAIQACDTGQVMLEQHIEGDDHRLLVVGGRFVAAIRRDPASVVGDGKSSIKQLIELKNRPRKSNPYTGKTLLALDSGVVKRLQQQSLTPDSILESGRKVYLQSIANIGAGGDSYDITEQVHPDFVRLAEQCWHAFDGLAFCGIDLLAEDIRRPAAEQNYAVIEINANCDVAMHHFPTVGQARDAAGSVINYLFEATDHARQQQLQLVVKGKVQQVGFRRWLKKQALMRGITGWVQNKQDGSVQALLQGTVVAVNDLISCCGQGPEKAMVNTVHYTEANEPRATGFVIKEL